MKNNKKINYAVLGAGPSGILCVLKLLDNGIHNIFWADPDFKVGKLGLYNNIHANTKNKYFIQALKDSNTFNKYLKTDKNLMTYYSRLTTLDYN